MLAPMTALACAQGVIQTDVVQQMTQSMLQISHWYFLRIAQ
jgi:hypothetical protein